MFSPLNSDSCFAVKDLSAYFGVRVVDRIICTFLDVVFLMMQYLWLCCTLYQGGTKQMTEGAQGDSEDSFSFKALFIHSGIVLQSHGTCQTLPDR